MCNLEVFGTLGFERRDICHHGHHGSLHNLHHHAHRDGALQAGPESRTLHEADALGARHQDGGFGATGPRVRTRHAECARHHQLGGGGPGHKEEAAPHVHIASPRVLGEAFVDHEVATRAAQRAPVLGQRAPRDGQCGGGLRGLRAA